MGVGMCSSRTVLALLSLFFLFATVVMWGLGGYVLATYKQISQLSTAYYTLAPALVMIFVGIVFFVAGLSGCCSTIKQNRCCSITFFVFVFLTFVLLVTSTVLIFVYKKQINGVVEKESNRTMYEYKGGDDSTSQQVDYLQRQFHCCGSYNYSIWATTPWGLNDTNHVPLSCCKVVKDCKEGDVPAMGKNVSQYIYTDGCVATAENFFHKNLKYLAIGALAFLLILILGMIGSCVVMCKRNENPYFNLS